MIELLSVALFVVTCIAIFELWVIRVRLKEHDDVIEMLYQWRITRLPRE